MSELVLDDAFISIDAVDLSDKGTSVTLDLGRQMKPKTAFSDNTENFLAGLKTNRVTVEMNQDFAAAKVDVTIQNRWNLGTAFVVIIRSTSAVVGATNPNYIGNMLVESYQPFSGRVGDEAKATVVMVPSDGTGLARAES